MTALTYPRYPIVTGLIVTLLLMTLGIGAIVLLMVTPLAGVSPSSDFAAVDIDRVLFGIKSACYQAALSTVLSILLAIPMSIAIERRWRWPGMKLVIMLISLAMVLPTTVAAMGLLSVWGRGGFFAELCAGFCDFSIYGLHGVVLAHLLLNLPLAIRVMIPFLQAVPDAQWRLCGHLGMTALQRFHHVEWPAIRAALPGLAGLIFLLCFTSFSLVLMLGGGPKVTTLEVEIYSAIRFDFNISAAAGISLIQFVLAAMIVAATTIFGGMAVLNSRSQYTPSPRFDLTLADLFYDIGILALLFILVVMPVLMAGLNGFNEGLIKLLNRPQFWEALHTSAQVSLITATIVTFLGIIMANAKAGLGLPHRYGRFPLSKFLSVLMDQGMMLYLVMPSIVLGTSAFILLRERGDVFGYAFAVVIVANTLLALPFAYRLLEVRMSLILANHDKLAGQLGVVGLQRLRVLTLPALKPDIGLVAGLSAALSFGDLGVIALFANADFRTLPWLLYQLAGKYAADEANALAMMLMVLTVLLFLVTRAVVGRVIGGSHA